MEKKGGKIKIQIYKNNRNFRSRYPTLFPKKQRHTAAAPPALQRQQQEKSLQPANTRDLTNTCNRATPQAAKRVQNSKFSRFSLCKHPWCAAGVRLSGSRSTADACACARTHGRSVTAKFGSVGAVTGAQGRGLTSKLQRCSCERKNFPCRTNRNISAKI